MAQIVYEQDILLRYPSGGGGGLVFGDGDTKIYESADDALDLYIAGSTKYQATSTMLYMYGASTGYWALLYEAGSTTNPTFIPNRADLATGIGSGTSAQFSLIASSTEIARITATALLTNTINELTASAGVTIEGVKAIDSYFQLADITAPGTPASGYGYLYVNSDKIYFKNDTGTAYDLTAGTTPTDDILDWSTDKYTPWSEANKAAGRLYSYSGTFPTNNGNPLAYDGNFLAYYISSVNMGTGTLTCTGVVQWSGTNGAVQGAGGTVGHTGGYALNVCAGSAYSGSNSNGADLYLYGGSKDGSGVNGNVIIAYYGGSIGYVGIGVTDPDKKLEVNGDIKLTVSTDNFLYGDTGWYAQRIHKAVSASVAGAGWYRIARASSDREQAEITIYTIGGSYTPCSCTVRWFHTWGWSSASGLSVISESGGYYWSQFRVTDDGANYSYLEAYFTQAVSFYLSCSDYGGSLTGDVLSGSLSAGGGTVMALTQAASLFASSGYFTIRNDGIPIVSPGASGYSMIVGKNYGSGIFLHSDASASHYNWRISSQVIADGGIEFVPSTAVGGTTFSTAVMVIRQNGRVGMGYQTNPDYALEIGDDAGTAGHCYIKVNSSAGYETGIVFSSAGTNAFLIFRPASTTDMAVYDNANAKYRMFFKAGSTQNGRISIGNTGASYQNAMFEAVCAHTSSTDESIRIGSYYSGNFYGVGLNYYIDGSGNVYPYLSSWNAGTRYTNIYFVSNNTLIAEGFMFHAANELNYYATASDDGCMYINYRGYQDGTTYYRDFRIADGKNNTIFFLDGSAQDSQFTGTLRCTSAFYPGGSIYYGTGSTRYLKISDAAASTDGSNLIVVPGAAVTSGYNGGYLLLIGGNAGSGAQSGHVYIHGGTSATAGNVNLCYNPSVTSYGYCGIRTAASSSYGLYVSGAIYATGNITGNSDIRYKEDISPMVNPWTLGYKDIQVIRFRYRGEEDRSYSIGYSAQNLLNILPDCVSYAPDKDRYGVKQLNMEAVNTLAIQYVKSEVDTLRERVYLLEQEIERLKKRA